MRIMYVYACLLCVFIMYVNTYIYTINYDSYL